MTSNVWAIARKRDGNRETERTKREWSWWKNGEKFHPCCEKEIVELLPKKRRMISSLNDFLYSEFAEQQPNDDDWGNTFNIE